MTSSRRLSSVLACSLNVYNSVSLPSTARCAARTCQEALGRIGAPSAPEGLLTGTPGYNLSRGFAASARTMEKASTSSSEPLILTDAAVRNTDRSLVGLPILSCRIPCPTRQPAEGSCMGFHGTGPVGSWPMGEPSHDLAGPSHEEAPGQQQGPPGGRQHRPEDCRGRRGLLGCVAGSAGEEGPVSQCPVLLLRRLPVQLQDRQPGKHGA